MTRILKAAARREAQVPLPPQEDKTAPTEERRETSAPNTPDSKPQHQAIDLVVDVIRELATWTYSERGADSLSDLLTFSKNLEPIPDGLEERFDSILSLPLTDLADIQLISNTSLLIDLLDVAGEDRKIFLERTIRIAPDRPTLKALGEQFGVSREHIRQRENSAINNIRKHLTEDRFTLLRWRASELASTLGPAVPRESPRFSNALHVAMRHLSSPDSCDGHELMLWLAGPYVTESGWLVHVDHTLEYFVSTLNQAFANQRSIQRSELTGPITDLGLHVDTATELLEETGCWRSIGDDCWIRWTGAVQDKAESVLHILGNPATVTDLNRHIGEGHVDTSVRNALSADDRFVRTDKNGTYALAEWGVEEYSGVATEMIERIEQAGGEIPLDALTDELVQEFGVSRSSIAFYASTPAFVLDDGQLRIRGSDEPYEVDDKYSNVKGLYLDPPDQVILHEIVDHDLLRGSGRSVREPVGHALKLRPGDRMSFTTPHGSTVLLSWPMTSTSGVALGSRRAIARDLGLEHGDCLRLVFDLSARTCRGERADSSSIQGATGLRIPQKESIQRLAKALNVEPQFVRAKLQARGDHDVLALLPDPEFRSEVDAAIAQFGDLLDD